MGKTALIVIAIVEAAVITAAVAVMGPLFGTPDSAMPHVMQGAIMAAFANAISNIIHAFWG